MNASPILLIGIGGAGASIARGINRASGDGVRYVLADTDATTGSTDAPFVLLGGDRLSGHGAGGDVAQAKLAAEDSLPAIDDAADGVRLVVIVTSLGGGTGGGATHAIARHLRERGVPTIVFATLPFAFEGEERQRNAIGMKATIAEEANAAIFIPLDKLIGDADAMEEALRRAVDTLASAITLFWRLVAKPGYIKLDTERVRHIIAHAGNGRFAVATAQGPNRTVDIVNALSSAQTLTAGTNPVSSILCGVLAGEDLRLSEIGKVADGVRAAFGERCTFDLGTVNDEATFCGRLSVVVMLFEAGGKTADGATIGATTDSSRRGRRLTKNPLSVGPQGRGRFYNAEQTIWRGEDLDRPTYLRRNISLDL